MGEEGESPTGVRSARQSWRQVIRQGSRRRRGRPLRIPRQSHRSGGRTLTLGPACNCRNHSILCTSGSVSDLNKTPQQSATGPTGQQVAGCPKTGRDDVGVPLAQGWGLRVIHHAAGIPGRPRTSGRVPAAVWIPNAICPGRLLAKESARVGRWVGDPVRRQRAHSRNLPTSHMWPKGSTMAPCSIRFIGCGPTVECECSLTASRSIAPASTARFCGGGNGGDGAGQTRRHGGTEMHGEGNRQRSRGASVRLRCLRVCSPPRSPPSPRPRCYNSPLHTAWDHAQAASIGTPDFP